DGIRDFHVTGVQTCALPILPGGSVGGPPQQENQTFEYSVILDGDLSTEEEFRNIIVKTNPTGSPVYLKDVARVELGEFAYNITSKVNGKTSSMMGIYQTPGGNAVQTRSEEHTSELQS